MSNLRRGKRLCGVGQKDLGQKHVLLLMLAAVVLAVDGMAGTVVSNLEDPNQSSVSIHNGIWFGSAFQVPSDEPDYRLDGITLAFGDSEGVLGNYSAAIYSDTAGPAAELETLTGTLPRGAGHHEFTSTGLTLEVGSTYWLALRSTESTGGWQNFLTPGSVSSIDGNWVLRNELFGSFDQGSNWSRAGEFSLVYSIQATPVPEPHEYAILMGLGLIGFGAMRRRLRRATGGTLAGC